MISCEQCEALINDRLDDCLTEENSFLLKEHLDQCPNCQRLDWELTSLHERLISLAQDPSAEFAAAILSQLEVSPMQPEKKKKKAPWAALACVAAALVLLVVVISPQMSPFGGSAGETAAAESTAAPEAGEAPADTAPAEGTRQEESQTETEAEEEIIEPLTEKKALKYLNEYLDMVGYSLTISDGMLSEDGSFWTFTGRSEDTSERFLFNVYSSDGFVEEVLLP